MITDVFQKLNLDDQKIPLDLKVPNDFYQTLLEQLMGRDYLSDVSTMKFLDLHQKTNGKSKPKNKVNWIQITRLPIHPNENESYDLLSRWQGVLSSLHAWGYRLYFLLLRYEGSSKLFLGTASLGQDVSSEDAVEQLREATFGSMPGMGMQVLTDGESILNNIVDPLNEMNAIGAVTGIPSFQQTEKKGLLQTLDQLAFGIRDSKGNEKDYAMLVIADPISDDEIADVISRHRRLSSQIHTAVKMTGSEGSSKSESYDPNAKVKAGANLIGTIVGGIVSTVFLKRPSHGSGTPNLGLGAMIGAGLANAILADASRGVSVGGSQNVSYEYLDKFAEYAEKATEHHIERLNEGRNYGFWNTGIYVLGKLPVDVQTVTGMLRSIYSGEETYYEPIRLHLLKDPTALTIVRNHFDMLPLLDANVVKPQDGFQYDQDQWHIFGRYYQYLSTPMNTKELSLATSLPRRDVPGLRFVKTAVRFANNPAEISAEQKLTLGNVVDTGIVQGSTYNIDINSLVRHALVVGSTGSGKSTTCKKILQEALKKKIPILVVEPAKDDYVRWAMEMNKTLPADQQFKIYMPGLSAFEGTIIEPLKLNLFEPASIKGANVDIMQHSEIATTLLNACLPSEEVVPILIEETVNTCIEMFTAEQNVDINSGSTPPLAFYPTVGTLKDTAEGIMDRKKYAGENKTNLKEVLTTRFASLKRGTRGKILNVDKSTDFDTLFGSNVIINISRMSGTKDKALVMSLLMQALYEYRVSCYTNDADYRRKAQNNELLHLALIEEAHNVLLKPDGYISSGNPQKAAADLFGNMLSEVRGYGQGFLIVDQVPTRLIDDAIKNTNYKIVHRTVSPDDQDLMSSCMALRDDQKYLIPALEKGNAIICGDEDDAAVWVKIPKPMQ